MLKLTKKEAELYAELLAVFQTSFENLDTAFTNLELELDGSDRVVHDSEDEDEDRERLGSFAEQVGELNPEEILRDRLIDLEALKSRFDLDLPQLENA